MNSAPLRAFISALVIGLATAGCRYVPFPATQPSLVELSVRRMEKSVTYLASDELEGRGVNTEGINKAADFIAGRLASLGLKQVRGADGYFQHFTMRGETTLEPDTSLRPGDVPARLNTDFRPYSFSAAGSFSGPVTFIGYAVDAPEKGYSDFEGVNLKGRVAMAMRYEPHDPTGKSRLGDGDWSEHSSLVTKAEAAARAGAVALLIVHPPTHHGSESLERFNRRFSAQPAGIPVIQITQKLADELLALGNVRDLRTLQELIDAEFRSASAELDEKVIVSGKVNISRKELAVKNVLAALPGRGQHAGEWIVVGAHYDHLGFGGRGSLLGPTTRAVHNGADDNASGTAAALELAERLSRRRFPLRRSVLFIFFTAEETGLLGSDHFVKHPLVPLDRIVAMFNMDMVGRMVDNKLYVGGRETAPMFEALIHELNANHDLKLSRMSRITFGSSDHASFMAKRIPVLFLFTGLHSDYHRPTDDVEKINFPGMAKVVDFAQDIVVGLSMMPRQPYTAPPPPARVVATGPATQGARPQLGIIPVYTEDETIDGILISGATPGTAAAEAGLRDRDVIMAINGRRMRTLEDLVEFLDHAKVGDRITLHLLRDQKPLDVEATLKARTAD